MAPFVKRRIQRYSAQSKDIQAVAGKISKVRYIQIAGKIDLSKGPTETTMITATKTSFHLEVQYFESVFNLKLSSYQPIYVALICAVCCPRCKI